jgi:hypothetical protein
MTPDEAERHLAETVLAYAEASTYERPFASRNRIADDLAMLREAVLQATDPDEILWITAELLACGRRLCDHLGPAARAQARHDN